MRVENVVAKWICVLLSAEVVFFELRNFRSRRAEDVK